MRMWGPNHVPSCPPVPLTGRTELACQSSQSLSRCSLDPTDPPVSTCWQDSQPLWARAAEKPSLGAFEIGPDGELSGVLLGQSCSTSERVRRARHGPAHATCVCSPPNSRVWSALYIHTHLGFSRASRRSHVMCRSLPFTCH